MHDARDQGHAQVAGGERRACHRLERSFLNRRRVFESVPVIILE